jgi:hypothetical protein
LSRGNQKISQLFSPLFCVFGISQKISNNSSYKTSVLTAFDHEKIKLEKFNVCFEIINSKHVIVVSPLAPTPEYLPDKYIYLDT